ncbi:MAG: malectin domain-containing carbohydrate-binding protein, partial [Pseudomonadota bacterium]
GVSGDFSVRWYDVIEGTYHNGTVQSVSGGSKVNLGQAPNDRNDDWAILVEADGTAPPPTDPPSPPAGDPIYQMEDGLVIMQAESGVFLFEDNDANATWKLITDQNGYKGDGYLLFDTGTDYFDGKWAGTPVTAPMKYTFRIDGEDAAGTYYINIRSTKPNTGETSDRNNDFFVASGPAGEEPSDWKKVFFGGGPNKWLWGQTYDVNHVHTDATFEVDGPGDYTIYVSGRSRQAAFDEIHISKDGFHYDVSKPTSPTVGGTTPPADDPPADDPPADDPPADDPPADDPPIDPPTDVDFELSLIDIATGLVVEELENGEEVAYAQVEGKELTLVATPVDENGDPVPVGSVRFDAGSLGTRVESVAPFALYGDTDSAYLGGTVMGTGSYTVTMQAFAGESASGSSLGATTIAFSVGEAEVEDRPPEATDVTYDTAEDSGAKTFEASAFATDPDGDAVFIRSVAGATLGTVSVASGGTALTYTPTANANGTDTVTVRMWDGSDPGTTVNATLTVDLSAVNDTPEAVDDAITVTSGETTWIASRLLGNDTDVEGDDLTIAVLSEIGEGLTLDLRPNGGMNITAERGTGTATFQYTVSDGQTTSVPATVTVTVEDAPLPDPDPDPDPEPPVDDEPGTVIAAINIGGGAYEGSDGTNWAADTTGEGNVYVRTDAVDILGTDDDPLYHSEAWGRRGLDYDFDVSDGTYKVELHFAEIWSKAKTAGKRVFDVEIEGATVVDNLDLAGDHGYETAYVMTTEVTVTDGNLDIDLKKGVQNPKLSAIKITALDDAPSEPGPEPISEYLQFSIGDSVTDGFLESIDYSGQTFDLEDGASPVVFANALDGVTEVESVALTIGGKRQVESFEPYSLFSDIKGDFRDDGFLSEGDHTVKIEVYSGNRGTGDLLETVEFDLALI